MTDEAKTPSPQQTVDWDPLGGNLILILSPPRSGSTMFQFMIESHSKVHGVPEPFILVPLRYAGYFAKPIQADYDTVTASLAIREFVQRLPRGEEDYVQACRAYANTLYAAALSTAPGCRYFIDKTPNNVLEWELIVRIYPKAKYLVLVRHPVAILDSVAKTFFNGDYSLMAEKDSNLVLPDYVPAIAAFLQRAKVDKLVQPYESLVTEPETNVRRIAEFLDLTFEPAMIEYGDKPHLKGAPGLGDPISAYQQSRPVSDFVTRWAQTLRDDPIRLRAARSITDRLNANDLAAYGYPADQLFDLVEADTLPAQTRRPARRLGWFHSYLFQRRVFFLLLRLSRIGLFRRILEKLRYYCDVLLSR